MGSSKGFNDKRGKLFYSIIKILKAKQPRHILLENIHRLKTHDNGNTFKIIEDELNNAGYNITYDIFNTADFGLPQNHRRIFIFRELKKYTTIVTLKINFGRSKQMRSITYPRELSRSS